MRKLFYFFKQNAERLHLHWVSHYNRVTGKPPASGFSFTLYDSITQLPESVWDQANTSGDIFLSSTYLMALEQAPPANMSFCYALIKKENAGVASFPTADFVTGKSEKVN